MSRTPLKQLKRRLYRFCRHQHHQYSVVTLLHAALLLAPALLLRVLSQPCPYFRPHVLRAPVHRYSHQAFRIYRRRAAPHSSVNSRPGSPYRSSRYCHVVGPVSASCCLWLKTLVNSNPFVETAALSEADPRKERALDIAARHGLTSREQDILLLLSQGHSAARIGELLYISAATVQTHTKHIYAKLGVHSRQEIIDLFA